jgi:hypothetical protein
MINKSVHVEVVLNDIHIPKQNNKALNCALKAIEFLKPDGITLNGDIMDSGTFSRHDRFSPPKCHWTDSQFYKHSKHEYDGMIKLLDRIDRIAPKARKRYEMGNHEVWVEDFIKESPAIRRPRFSLEDRLGLKKRGYSVYKYNDFMHLGKLKVTHGIYSGQNHAKKHLNEMGTSILYGHLHNIEVASKVTPARVSHMAWANGCLCNLNPTYLRNKPQNWNHSFAIVYVWPSGEFQVDVIRIQNGRCVVQGKEIRG